jgi:hypothetical protein
MIRAPAPGLAKGYGISLQSLKNALHTILSILINQFETDFVVGILLFAGYSQQGASAVSCVDASKR